VRRYFPAPERSILKISGFTYACNTDSHEYPLKESILSILPVCDEFIAVIGNDGAPDTTRETVASIGDPKIRIIDTQWRCAGGTPAHHIFREQANIALGHCRGDWCFHVQCDEVVHENDLPLIRRRCTELLPRRDVEGMLLRFRHFWGDYDHYLVNHRWFPYEVRIVRNSIGIQSWADSQSFRKEGKKIRAVLLDAHIFHYAYARPPRTMKAKQVAAHRIYHGTGPSSPPPPEMPWIYGSLEKVPVFRGTHPLVMAGRIARMDWAGELQYHGRSPVLHKHERLKYRLLTFIEQKLLGGRWIGGYRNYNIVKA
jgi:hypothetical protein